MTWQHSISTDFLVRLAKYLSDTISPWKCQNADAYKNVPLCIETCDLLGIDIRPIIDEAAKSVSYSYATPAKYYPVHHKIHQLLEEKFSG